MKAGGLHERKHSAPAADEAEFAKQIRNYADAITAFAILQCIAFCYSVEKGDSMTCNALKYAPIVYISNALATCAYLFGLWCCSFGEDKLISPKSLAASILYVRTWLRRGRVIIVLCAGMFALFTMLLLQTKQKDIADCQPHPVSAPSTAASH
jgi:hypothetical protein